MSESFSFTRIKTHPPHTHPHTHTHQEAGGEVAIAEVEVLTPVAACIRVVAQHLSDGAHEAATRLFTACLVQGDLSVLGIEHGVCVCVCVCEREGKREREKKQQQNTHTHTLAHIAEGRVLDVLSPTSSVSANRLVALLTPVLCSSKR